MKIHLPEKERKAVEELKQELHRIYGERLKKMVLFGSYARGQAKPLNSDLDILIVGKNFDNAFKEIDKIIKSLARISLKYDTLISVVPVKEKDFLNRNTPLLLNVRREGIEI